MRPLMILVDGEPLFFSDQFDHAEAMLLKPARRSQNQGEKIETDKEEKKERAIRNDSLHP